MNKKMLNLFWYWMNERHSIYMKKKNKKEWPWTKDKILQEYKFTNVFRQLDRVTQELAKRKKDLKIPARNPSQSNLEKLFFHVVAFRMFNWPPTYDILNEAGLVDKWNEKKAIKLLQKHKVGGNKVFTGAYVITNSGRTEDKITVVCEAITAIWKDRGTIVHEMNGGSLEDAAKTLLPYPCFGKFIAYEVVTDLRHTPLLNKAKDIMAWANPGPGAKRGLNRVHSRELKFSQPDKKFIEEMRSIMELSNVEIEKGSRGRLSILAKDKRKLEMRDVEHWTCEADKIWRIENGEGRPRSKYKPPAK